MKYIHKSMKGAGGVRSSIRRRTKREPTLGRQIITMTDSKGSDGNVLMPILKGRYEQNEFRKGEYLHVSDLLYKCIRKVALSEKLGEDIHAETIWPGRALTFQFGHTVEDYVRDLAKRNAPHQLYGNWLCPCERLYLEDRTWHQVKNKNCKTCGHPPIKYKEKVVTNDEYMVTGSVDVPLLIEDYFYLNECKSMAGKSWQELKRPKPEHLLQVLMYWWLFKKAGFRLWDRVSVLYVNKEYMWSGLPFKEYWFQPSMIEDRLDDLLAEAKQFADFRKEGKELPPRAMCDDKDSPDAKHCQFRHVCFEME